MCEYILVVGSSGDEFEVFVGVAFFAVLIVDSAEEPSVEAELGENACLGLTVSERVDLPAH